MPIHTPEAHNENPSSPNVGPFLRALTAVVVAVTSISGQTGCAALNAVRVKTVGSDFDKKLFDLDEEAREVAAADIPEVKKAGILTKIEAVKKILRAYNAYETRDTEIDKMEADLKASNVGQAVRDAKSEIISEYRSVLRDPIKQPLRDMLNNEEIDEVANLYEEIEKAKATLANAELQKLSKFEWPKTSRGAPANEEDVKRWVNELKSEIADLQVRLEKLGDELTKLVTQKAAPVEIENHKYAISLRTEQYEKAKTSLSSLEVVVKGMSAIQQLHVARETLRLNPEKIQEVGQNALNRAAGVCRTAERQ